MSAFEQVGEALRLRFGIAPRSRWEDDVQRAVDGAAKRHGLSASRASSAVLSSPALLREVAETMTVGESYFFRHLFQLEMATVALAKRLSEGESVVAWSAGCCRGEEPHSLAILLDQHIAPSTWTRVELLASDMHADSVELAKRAKYGEWSLRQVGPDLRARYFGRDGQLKLRPEARSRLNFVCSTLRDHLQRIVPGSIDVVLFRNVAVYMTPERLDQLYEGFSRVLRPGGLLITAPSDPPPAPGSLFRLESMGTSIYRCREAEHLLPASAPSRAPRSATSIPAPRHPSLARSEATTMVKRGVALADSGLLDAAMRLLDQVVREHPSLREARTARVEVLFGAHRFEEALREVDLMSAARMSDASSRYLGALSMVELGRRPEASQRLKALARDLGARPREEKLKDRTTRAGELLDAVQHELERIR